jgi:hypothetical protein
MPNYDDLLKDGGSDVFKKNNDGSTRYNDHGSGSNTRGFDVYKDERKIHIPGIGYVPLTPENLALAQKRSK